MNRKINRVKLYVKDTDKAHLIEKLITDKLLNNNFIIDNDEYDMAISIGGDGTFIKMLHNNNFNNNIYYAAINAGSLGFLSSIESDDIEKFINNLNNDLISIRELDLLKTRVYKDNIFNDYLSINEITIRKSDFSSLRCDVKIDNNLFENYVGDGLVVSTSTGSTGYNYALGGAIIDSSVKAYLLSSIAPINNKVYKTLSNSLVLSNNKKISIVPSDNTNLCILNDGKIIKINDISKIECTMEGSIKCIVLNEYSNIINIKSKIIDSM